MFDGVDDLISSTVDVFPPAAFTVMFWVRGIAPTRAGQALVQVISPEKGLEFQLYNSQNLELFIHGSYSGQTGIDVNSGVSSSSLILHLKLNIALS